MFFVYLHILETGEDLTFTTHRFFTKEGAWNRFLYLIEDDMYYHNYGFSYNDEYKKEEEEDEYNKEEEEDEDEYNKNKDNDEDKYDKKLYYDKLKDFMMDGNTFFIANYHGNTYHYTITTNYYLLRNGIDSCYSFDDF